MAMSGKQMGDAVAAAVAGVVPPSNAAISTAQLQAIWEAACTAIVQHITANAVVAVPASGLSTSNGPVTGAAVGQVS